MRLNIPEYPTFMRWCKTVMNAPQATRKGPKIASIFTLKEFQGVPTQASTDKHGWVGKHRLLYLAKNIPAISQLHEAFHYFLCPKERLKYNDFGLGIGFDSFGLRCKCVISQDEADIEEIAVCILTLIAGKRLGLGKDILAGEMDLVSITETDEEAYYRAIDKMVEADLERHGFILTGKGL